MNVVETGIRYDHIPTELFINSKDILDIGNCGGVNFSLSRHAVHLDRCEYMGLDLDPPENPPLPTITGDVISWEAPRQYDLVLVLHILEHIPFDEWGPIFERLKACTNKYLVVGVPYKERDSSQYDGLPYHLQHRVFGINKRMFRPFLPNARFLVKKGPNHFNSDGASLLWATLRLIKRLVTRHPYARQRRLLVIWEKEVVL